MSKQIGRVICADGTERTIHPGQGGKFSLSELQAAVGGLIEIVPMKRGNGHATMYVNEEGKLLHLPPNARATELTDLPSYGDWVCGSALIVSVVKE